MIRSSVLPAMPYPWVVVTLCLVVTIAVSTYRQGIGVLYPFIQEDLEISRAQIGLLASGAFMGAFPTSLFAGWLADVVGVRRLQTLTMAALFASMFLFSLAQSFVQAFLLTILVGVSLSTSFPVTVKGIVDWATPRTRGLALGIMEAVIPIGAIFSAVLLPFLAEAYSWRLGVIVMAFWMGASGVIFFIFYRDRSDGYIERRGSSKPSGKIAEVARNRGIWLIAFFGCCLSSTNVVLFSYLVLFLKEDLGLSPVVAGGSLAVGMVGSAVGRVVWGVVSDLILQGRRVEVLACVCALSVVAVALLIWLPSDASLVVVWSLIFFIGITAMGWSGLWTALISELAGPALTGTAVGFVVTITSVSIMVVTPLFGFLVDRTESYDIAWGALAGLTGLGTLLLAFLPRGRARAGDDGVRRSSLEGAVE